MLGIQKRTIKAAELQSKPRTKLPRFLILLCLGLMVLQVLVSNRLANMGLKISEIDQHIQEVTGENNDLRGMIASESALLSIKQKAHELGFVQPGKPVYLSNDLPFAQAVR